MTASTPAAADFEAFWPFYVSQHSRAATRVWHLAGTTLALACVLTALWTERLPLYGLALPIGYGCAWIGHFFVEHNRPATFRHPLWSLRADLRMYRLMLLGRMRAEVERATASLAAAP